jgi:spermidine synthase
MRLKPGKWHAARADDDIEVTEARGVRSLHLGSCAIQSAMRISRPWDLELAYTRAMMGFLMFRQNPGDVLMIGLGGGSLAKFIRKHRPDTRVTAVEIDPRVIAVARAQFEVPPDDDRFAVVNADGALYVRQHAAAADVILLDGYDANNQVEALATESFYAACRRALKPRGILVVNLWGRDSDFREYFARLVRAFDGEVAWLSVQNKTNVIVFAFTEPGARAHLDAVRAQLPQLSRRYGLDMQGFARDLQWADAIAPLLA